MATATAKKATSKKASKGKAEEAVLKPRPGNLTKVSKPTDEMPVALEIAGDEPTTAEVATWMNGLGDAHEEKGEVLTPAGYKVYTEQIEDDDMMKAVQKIAKGLLTVGLAKAAAAAKPSTNGAAKAAVIKPKAEKAEASESTPMALKNRTNVPVDCSESGTGRKRCRIFEYPLRNVIRAMAKKGWDNDEIEAALKKMGIAENYHEELRSQIIVPHAAAGRNAKGDETVYGDIPSLSKNEWALLEGVRK